MFLDATMLVVKQVLTTQLFNTRATEPSGRITFSIRLWDRSGKIVIRDLPFTIKPTSPLRAVFRIFSLRESPHTDCLGYFKFVAANRVLTDEDRPCDIGIGDGDCIDALPPDSEDYSGSRFV
jgi:hypothetical protein